MSGKVRAIIIGFGNVGRFLAKYIIEERTIGDTLDIVSILSSRGGVLIRSDEDVAYVLKLASTGQNLDKHPKFLSGMSLQEILSKEIPDLAFIAIPPSYITGEPNRGIYYELMRNGVSIITADKTVLALEYGNFIKCARKEGIFVGFRATVAAGTPLTDVVKGIYGRDVIKFRAILNSKKNYIIDRVSQGLSIDEAIKETIRMGLAEPDPSIDVDGWDAAAKITILANVAGMNSTIHDVERVSLRNINEEQIREAYMKGLRVKYVAEADFKTKRLRVSPVMVQPDDPLYGTSGIQNVLDVSLEDDQRIVIVGPAGPAWRTAKVMITDYFEFYLAFKKSEGVGAGEGTRTPDHRVNSPALYRLSYPGSIDSLSKSLFKR